MDRVAIRFTRFGAEDGRPAGHGRQHVMKAVKKACAARSAIVGPTRPAEWIENPVGVVVLVDRALLATEPEGGVALLKRGLATAGARKLLVGIGIARRAVAIGIALVVDGEGVRRGRGRQRQAERGGQNGHAMTQWAQRRMLHDGLTDVRGDISQNNMAAPRQIGNLALPESHLLSGWQLNLQRSTNGQTSLCREFLTPRRSR